MDNEHIQNQVKSNVGGFLIVLIIYLLLTTIASAAVFPGTLDTWSNQIFLDRRPLGFVLVLYAVIILGGALGLHGIWFGKRHAKLAILLSLAAQMVWFPIMTKISGQQMSIGLVFSVLPLAFALYVLKSKRLAARIGLKGVFF